MDTSKNSETTGHVVDDTCTRHAPVQQRWHGWGSPVGLGIGLLALCLGLASMLVAIAMLSGIGSAVSS